MNVVLSVLCMLVVAVSSIRDRDMSRKERPLMKIVRLLQDMQAQLQKEAEDDAAVYESLGCWCKSNDEEKSKAVELAEAKIIDLKSSMAEFVAKIEELREGLKQTREKARADQQALDTATELRMKEKKVFHAEETDLLSAIQSVKQALVVMSKHHPSLEQLRTVARSLEALKSMSVAKDSLGGDQMAVLKAFLQESDEGSSFLASRVPGFSSYEPQSGQIFGILKTMQEDFEKNLAGSQEDERKAIEDYTALAAAKRAELAAGKKQLDQLQQDDAAFREKNAQAYEEFNDTQEQLAIDQEFLTNLRKKCSATDADYAARTKARQEEISAIEDTVGILNDDSAFENADKTVNSFVQISSSKDSDRRAKAAKVLLQNASPALAMLATAVQIDAFDKVKAAIDKMIDELNKQQAEEVTHRDWCTDEMHQNAADTAEQDDKKTNLVASIEDMTKAIEELTKKLEENTQNIKDMNAEMKKASEIREGESADFRETVTDQRITQTVLQKAISRMNEAYSEHKTRSATHGDAFEQSDDSEEGPGAAHTQTSGTHTDPGNGPARFNEYEQHAGGKRVVAMLETVMKDSKTMEDQAINDEQGAQVSYETFMKDSNRAIKEAKRANVNMSENKAKTEESLGRAKTDLTGTMTELENLHNVLGDLKKSCDFVLDNFSKRQEARAAEVDALKEAKAILSGA